MYWNHYFIFINYTNCFQSLFFRQKILLSVSLAWSQQRKARFPTPRPKAVLFPRASVTGRMQPLNSANIKIPTAIKKLWKEVWNSPGKQKTLVSSLGSPYRGESIQQTAVANHSTQHQVSCQTGIADPWPWQWTKQLSTTPEAPWRIGSIHPQVAEKETRQIHISRHPEWDTSSDGAKDTTWRSC